MGLLEDHPDVALPRLIAYFDRDRPGQHAAYAGGAENTRSPKRAPP